MGLLDKDLRKYRKMCRQHRRELIKIAKNSKDFDWEYLHEFIITKVRHMYEYYTKHNNVWQSDETCLPTVGDLAHVLSIQKKIDQLYAEVPDDLTDVINKEAELYKELYSYIGEHLLRWWD